MSISRCLPLLLLLTGCAGGAPGPQSCTLVREAELPVTFARNLPIVEVMLNGKKAKLIFDTGAQLSVVFEPAINRLGLATDPIARTIISGVGGYSSHNNALVDLQVGTVSRHNLSIGVLAMNSVLQGGADGVLGNDLLERFDLDIDMPHRKVGLYRQRNCPNGAPDWTTPAELLPPSPLGQSVPATMISLELDGVSQNAEIDTGAENTALDLTRAIASGVSEETLQADLQGKTQGAAPVATATALHRFTTIKVGTETIAKPPIVVTTQPHMLGNSYYGMLLGEDYLRKHRVWIAYSDYKVFVARPTQ